MNTELFKQIHEVISTRPAEFAMDDWELGEDIDDACGTTRCVAGWAVHLTTGESVYVAGISSPATRQLALNLGVPTDVEDIAARLLGLERNDVFLFYTSYGKARDFVALAAAGDDEGARRILRGK